MLLKGQEQPGTQVRTDIVSNPRNLIVAGSNLSGDVAARLFAAWLTSCRESFVHHQLDESADGKVTEISSQMRQQYEQAGG